MVTETELAVAPNPATQAEAKSPTWARVAEIPAVVSFPGHLRKTMTISLIVGIVLFSINQLDVVVSGHATALVWFKTGLTFVVPFCVANYGILVATHRREAGA